MVVLNRIYTRTGDDGTTALGTGERRKNRSARSTPTARSTRPTPCIGLARLHTADDAAVDAMLARIQNDLFDLGADLCDARERQAAGHEPLRIVEAQVDRLEREIDALNAGLAPLRSFVLPGGTPAAAYLHLARTVCRRAERLMVALADTPERDGLAGGAEYLNRLSDFLFVAAARQRQGARRRALGARDRTGRTCTGARGNQARI